MLPLQNLAHKGLKAGTQESIMGINLPGSDPVHCQISDIRHTKYQSLTVFHLVLQLSLCNIS